jgi:hypothetical protein
MESSSWRMLLCVARRRCLSVRRANHRSTSDPRRVPLAAPSRPDFGTRRGLPRPPSASSPKSRSSPLRCSYIRAAWIKVTQNALKWLDEQLARVNEMYEVGAIDRESVLHQARAINEEKQRLREQAAVHKDDTDLAWCGHRSSRCFRSGILPTGASVPSCWPPSLSVSRLIRRLTARSSSLSFLGPAGSRSLEAWYWSGRRDSNPRQPAWRAGALPAELLPRRALF